MLVIRQREQDEEQRLKSSLCDINVHPVQASAPLLTPPLPLPFFSREQFEGQVFVVLKAYLRTPESVPRSF